MARLDVQMFDSREEALKVEAVAVRDEKPVHNLMHTPAERKPKKRHFLDSPESATFTVRAEWERGWWVVTVPDVPGAITQVKRLDQVARDATEVIEIQTGREVQPGELKIEWNIAGRAGEYAQHARNAREQLDEYTRNAVRELRAAGFSLRDTGALTGISFQRVQQIEKELKAS